ncbi:hypothetical protein BV898_10220 [Hypsibius exemplaris]|uniref:Receptor ligand binding region domain-containing protein n=1 Tax=Hypsibius exemplaris TaxID=2072580 RepID=A0A1W0WKH4_HYPEX|nr:hypothetical protein BV898_10220 [Hypsibius exemplaris]
MFDLISRKRGFPVLFSPGCSLEVAPLADFAREMDVLLIASTSADTSFANRARYPTFVSFGPTGQGGHVPSLKRFLRKFAWTTVTVFCESMANYLNVASFFGLTCRSIKALIASASDEFTVYYEDFDSRSPKVNFRGMLERAKSQSRVIVIETREDIVQKIMIAAYKLRMTAEEYVFIYPEPNRLPLYISLLEPTEEFTGEVAVEAFLPLIVLNFDYPDWQKLRMYLKPWRRLQNGSTTTLTGRMRW